MSPRRLVRLVSIHCERGPSRRAIYEGLIAEEADPHLLDAALGIDPVFDTALAYATRDDEPPPPLVPLEALIGSGGLLGS